MEEEKQPLSAATEPPKKQVQEIEEESGVNEAPPKSGGGGGGGGGGWGGWGFSAFSVLSDLQKAAEEISRNAAAVAQTAAKSIADLENEDEHVESSKEKEVEDSAAESESEDENDKLRKSALDKLEKASEDSVFGQGLKVLDTSVENIASGAWKALGSALRGGSDFVHKLENSAANIAETIQQQSIPAAAGSVAPSLLERGKALTTKGMEVLELVGKETMDLLITETGIEVEKGSNESEPHAEKDQLEDEEVTFDRCFYIYGGQEQLEELEALSNHYTLLYNRRKGKLSQDQKSVYDGKLKQVQQIFSLSNEMEGSSLKSDKGKKLEVGEEGNDEMKSLYDSSVSKAAEMAAGFGSSVSELAVPEIMQRTVDRLESLHSDGVHRLSEMCYFAVSQFLMLGKSIITQANKVDGDNDDEDEDENAVNIQWPEDSVEKAEIIRLKALSMTRYVDALSNSFITGISDVSKAYEAAMSAVPANSHKGHLQTSIQDKANAFSKRLRADQTTAFCKIQDGLQYLSYLVLSTSMPSA
ncbi:uncharacterized protein LOC111437779 [Cucurbita moschata]|uniref:Uncharacterized protein LOC111437779 n=1 Tax=Cucurbita moschata TaxID=3662 RepID=A0A6J1EUR0_CUCMO|nr:uncharacterized protein LOC111437779 [Cucurbita moschata]XP_022931613.1 uncharacterized protein LOC111437779 [Cucurbita moschata]XP_022931614.1 uncharacterized protein LOC111437779 [Cucurbita moschata]